MGENPAVGSANAKMQRLGMANLDWLVVRDFSLIESATWWKDGPEIETGELRTEDIGTEVFFFPAAAHTEKDGSFTNTNRMLQWHHAAVEPAGMRAATCGSCTTSAGCIREKLAGSTDRSGPADPRPDLGLPDRGRARRAERRGGARRDQRPRRGRHSRCPPTPSSRTTARRRCGCWIYCGVYADGVNQAARRKPAREQDWIARRVGVGVAGQPPHPLQPGLRRPRRRAVERAQGARLVGRRSREVDRPRRARLQARQARRTTGPPRTPTGPRRCRGTDPFIMQADGKGWLFAPAGLVDGPLPTHYEPQDSPFDNPLYAPAAQPGPRRCSPDAHNRYHPSGSEPGAEVFPYVVTTYRLTEHFTAGGMTRWSPYLAELQPEFFCEVSPELAAERELEHGGWATDRHRPQRDRGPGAGHRADDAAAGRRAARAPDRPALPLGPQRATHGRRRQRAVLDRRSTRTCTSRRSRR